MLLLAYWKTRINDFEIVENEVYEGHSLTHLLIHFLCDFFTRLLAHSGDRRSIPNNHGDYYRLFLFTMSIIVLVYCIIIALYFYQCYNSQVAYTLAHTSIIPGPHLNNTALTPHLYTVLTSLTPCSQVMLVVDSFVLSLVSIVIFVCFSWISYKMQLVLKYVPNNSLTYTLIHSLTNSLT